MDFSFSNYPRKVLLRKELIHKTHEVFFKIRIEAFCTHNTHMAGIILYLFFDFLGIEGLPSRGNNV